MKTNIWVYTKDRVDAIQEFKNVYSYSTTPNFLFITLRTKVEGEFLYEDFYFPWSQIKRVEVKR